MTRFGMVMLGAAVLAGLGGCEVKKQEAAAPAAGAEQGASEAPREAPIAREAGDSTLQWSGCPAPFPAGCEIAVLHGDPARPGADVFLRIPAGYAFPPHSHSAAERIVLVSGRLELKYQGSPSAVLNPGAYGYGPARLPHRATCIAAEACTLFIAFDGAVDVVPFEGAV